MNGSVSISAFAPTVKDEPAPEPDSRPSAGQYFGPASAPAVDAEQPPWADGRGLPTYFRHECPICLTRFTPGACQHCGKPLTEIPDPAVRGRGYESQTYDHFHFKKLDEVAAREAATVPLCLECYRADHLRAYPGHPAQV